MRRAPLLLHNVYKESCTYWVRWMELVDKISGFSTAFAKCVNRFLLLETANNIMGFFLEKERERMSSCHVLIGKQLLFFFSFAAAVTWNFLKHKISI
uniref:Secreted protein n=1 Tax=Parascaris univalens TaxID=6257 RepID=A0A915B872_PARUN